MAAITESRNKKTQKMTLRSSEFPDLKVEGYFQYEKDLRKKLNNMMRKRRAKSGGPTGKSPTEKKVKETPKKKEDKYKGHPSDLAFIKAQGKKKKSKDVEDMTPTKIGALGDQPPGYTSAVPKKPDPKKGGSALSHIRRAQEIEAKRKKEQRASQMATQTSPVISKRSHPSKIAEDRKLAGEKAKVEQEGRVHAGEFVDAQREQLQRPSFMSKRKWNDLPISERKKTLEQIKRTEEKAAIKSGVFSPILKEVSQILSAASPIAWEDPSKNKYTMLGGVDTSVRKELGLASPKGDGDPSPFVGPDKVLEQKPVTEKKLAELDAIDSKLKREEGERGQIEYGRGEYDQQEAPVVTNEDGGLMKKPDAPTKTGEISEEPVKYDKNGYPIYAKGSKKAAEWNAAYAAAEVGKFIWDGREYVKHGKPEEDEKAAVTEDKQAAVTGPVREAYDTGDANIAESFGAPEHSDLEAQESQACQQSDAQAQENEGIAQKITNLYDKKDDHEGNLPEVQKLTRPLSKEDTADVKEKSGKGRWYIDPWTGFAIDLNKLQKRQDRKDAMEFAALLPADKRATYLAQENLISPEDLEKLLEPSEMEKLERKKLDIQLDTASYNLVTAKLKRQDYRTPEEIAAADLKKTLAKEKRGEGYEIKKEEREEARRIAEEKRTANNKAEMDRFAGLYKNAITNDDFDGQIFWGTKMGLDPNEMKRIANSRYKLELTDSKKDGSANAFEEMFDFKYSQVLKDRKGFVMGTASLWTTGQVDIQFGDKQIKSREGLFNTLGVKDWDDMQGENATVTREQAEAIITGLPDQSLFRNPEYQNEDGSPDWEYLLSNEDLYKRFILDNVIYYGMDATYDGEYGDIKEWRMTQRKERKMKNTSVDRKLSNN